MENIFLDLFNMSINASWLVLAVILIRFLLKKAPKWVHCILWSIVGIKLVFPFSIESIFSIIPSKEFIAPSTLYEVAPTVDSGFNRVNEAINPVISDILASSPENSVNPLQVITIIASYLWVTGIAVMLLYTLITYISLKRKVGTSTKLTENIYESENVPSPFILGVIRPKIYLPYNIGEKDREYVIAHESAHLKRKDHLIKPFAFLILSVYWFNPLLWLAYILLCRDIELACDEKVVKDFNKDNCKEYSYALLNCSVNRKRIAACPLAFGEVGVKDRVKNVLNYKKPAFWIILVGVLACIITAACFLTVPKGVTLAEGYLYEPMSVKTDRLEITTPENTYIFTSESQIETLRELINGITVDKKKTEETEHPSKSLPEPSYVVKAFLGDVQTFERCVSSDFRRVWTSEEGECEYLFTSHKPKNIEALFTSKLKTAFIKQQADDMISELLVDFYVPQWAIEDDYIGESHYIFKEEWVNISDGTAEEITLYAIFNCTRFSYNKNTGALKNDTPIEGMAEFTFGIYDGYKVVYKDFTEHLYGTDAEIDDFGNTLHINEQLKEKVFEKAKRNYGIGVTLNGDTPQEETSNTESKKEEEETVNTPSAVDFSYDIVPLKPLIKTHLPDDATEKIIREKALNSST